MQSLVDYLARALVDDPSQVDVSEAGDDAHRIIRLKVAKSDLGKVIGKKGRTARALRTVLAAAASKFNKRFSLEILEPPPPAAPPSNGQTPTGDGASQP
jgi:predicted RNA-binding protein YlqC (UPF0109 family)